MVTSLSFTNGRRDTIKPPASEVPAAPAVEAAPAPALETPPATEPTAEPASSGPRAEQRRGLLSRIPGLGGDK